MMFDVIIVGGGAAGFFTAIQIAEANTNLKIAILERGKEVLTKVKVSGGGRCNVTHAEFNPKELVKNYPRGERELMGPFHTYAAGDVVTFFEEKGVPLKIESDGRMFPVSDSSQTIIDCFLNEVTRLGVQLLKNSPVISIVPVDSVGNTNAGWKVQSIHKTYVAKKIVVATGSNPKIWELLKSLGHTITPPVPSLFTFNINDPRITGIQGVSTPARITIKPKVNAPSKVSIELKSKPLQIPKLESEGPLLITHWGISGPAVLKLSAWGAIVLHSYNYKFTIEINWMPDYHSSAVLSFLNDIKGIESNKTVLRTNAVAIPRRLWINLVKAAGIDETTKWAEVTKTQLQHLSLQLTCSEFEVDGKSTFKEEFVTAGGVDLKELNFKTFESKIHPNLFFAGEVLNIDAITGGFNFQNAWTGAYIVAQTIAQS